MDAFFKNVSIFARKRREDKRIETSEIMCLLHVGSRDGKTKEKTNTTERGKQKLVKVQFSKTKIKHE